MIIRKRKSGKRKAKLSKTKRKIDIYGAHTRRDIMGEFVRETKVEVVKKI